MKDHYFRIRNNADLPVHVAISTAGVIQYHENDVAPRGGYTEFFVNDFIWHDVTILPSNGQNQFNAKDLNGWKIAEITVGSIGMLAAVAGGAVLAIPTAGGSVGVAVGIVVAIAGGLVAVTTGVVSVANFLMHPAIATNLYAQDGYDFDVTGGDFKGYQDKDEKWVITGYNPISIKWHNNTSGNTGTETATV